MTNEQAIKWLKAYIQDTPFQMEQYERAFEMAIKALENIGHLKDRPCSVCEFHKENGCCKWTCVFTDKLFGGMNE